MQGAEADARPGGGAARPEKEVGRPCRDRDEAAGIAPQPGKRPPQPGKGQSSSRSSSLGWCCQVRSSVVQLPFQEPRRGGPLDPAQGGVETSAARIDSTLGLRQRKRQVLKGRSRIQSRFSGPNDRAVSSTPNQDDCREVGFVFSPFGSPEDRPFRTQEKGDRPTQDSA